MNLLSHVPFSSGPIFFKYILVFFFPIIAFADCVTNRRISTRNKVLWGFAIALPWPILHMSASAAMAFGYSIKESGRRWLKIMASLWMVFFVAGSVFEYFNARKQISMLEQDRMNTLRQMGVRAAQQQNSIQQPANVASPQMVTLTEHMRSYQTWLDHQEYKKVVDAYKQDEGTFMRGDAALRRELSPVSFDVALAYRGLGQNKKSAYYYALAAKIQAETSPHSPVLRTYIDEAKALDPSSQFVKQVEQSIFH